MFMWPFKRHRPRKHLVRHVSFIASQNGSSETEFQRYVLPVLRDSSKVERAYLALASYDEGSTTNVVLGFSGEFDLSLVNAIGGTFRKMFTKSAVLDILHLTKDQEAEIGSVCAPFYVRSNNNSRMRADERASGVGEPSTYR